jgi:hypothetical protein
MPAAHWQFCQFDEPEDGLYDATHVIQRICAMSFVVLIATPFTAPFAVFDLRDSTARGRDTAIIDTVAAATPDDMPAWSDRSGRHHHAMQLAALNSGDVSLDAACPHTLLPPPAVTSVPHNTSVIAAVLRV